MSYSELELRQMLEDVVNELDLDAEAFPSHSPVPPAEMVRKVLRQKDMEIQMLKAKMLKIEPLGLLTKDTIDSSKP